MARGATMANPAAAPDGGAPRPRVVAIVPALDEEVAIARLLPEFPRAVVADVIVVDNGSRDATAAVTLLALDMEHPTYGWPIEMLVKAARHGYRIVGVAVPSRPRAGGQSKVGGTLRGSLLAGWHMIAVMLTYAVRRPPTPARAASRHG